MSLSHAELFPSSAQIRENPLGWQAAAQERWAQLGIHPEWFEALAGLGPALGALGDALAARFEQGEHILPAPQRVMRALELAPSQVRVLIVGQDPYPTPGHGVGLSFAVEPQVRPLPRSLQNLPKHRRRAQRHRPARIKTATVTASLTRTNPCAQAPTPTTPIAMQTASAMAWKSSTA